MFNVKSNKSGKYETSANLYEDDIHSEVGVRTKRM